MWIVMKCYLFQRFQLRQSKNDPSAKLIATKVSEGIKSIWDKAFIPTVTDEHIYQKVIDYHTSYEKLMKSAHQKNAEGFKIRCDNFHQQAQHIFDVAYCKCSPDSKCGCIKSKKVPIKRGCILDRPTQWTKMIIGSVDKKIFFNCLSWAKSISLINIEGSWFTCPWCVIFQWEQL